MTEQKQKKNNIIIADSLIVIEDIKTILNEMGQDFIYCSIQEIVKDHIKKDFPKFLLYQSEWHMCDIDTLFDILPLSLRSFIDDYKVSSGVSWFNELLKSLKDIKVNTIILEQSPELNLNLLDELSNIHIITSEDILQRCQISNQNFSEAIQAKIKYIYEAN